VQVTNPGGHDGSHGQEGARGRAIVKDGQDGLPGLVEILVEGDDGKFVGPYPSQYRLEVFDFDIVDSNCDGIFEFGEELTIRNIQVRNTGLQALIVIPDLGGAPSPKKAGVELYGESTSWLKSIIRSIPAPSGLMNNSTARVRESLLFRIDRPTTLTPGPSFTVDETVKLGGTFTRLGRNIPNFHEGRRIKIQHPVRMTAPKHLKTMAPGQEAKFHWTVKATTFQG